jgi:hypothetical protein
MSKALVRISPFRFLALKYPLHLFLLGLLLGGVCLLTSTAKADGFDNTYYVSALAASTYASPDQASSGSFAAILNVYSQAQGVDAYGRTYVLSSMAHADAGGLGLFASSSLTGGNLSGYGLGEAQAEAYASMSFDLIVPAGVYFISEELFADGHGTSRTGPDGYVSGVFDETVGNTECGLTLLGGVEEKSCGPTAVVPGALEAFLWEQG